MKIDTLKQTIDTAEQNKLEISGGQASGLLGIKAILTATATWDPGNLLDGAGTTQAVTVTGAALGDIALASFSLDLQDMLLTAYVNAANSVEVRLQNESTVGVNLASGTLRVVVLDVT